jgi:RecA-family ATPase
MNGAANGERNESLFQAACQMRDAGKDQHEIQTALMCRALTDGLGVEEVNKTIVSVFKRPAREAATKKDGRQPKRTPLRYRTPVTYKQAPKGEYKLAKRKLPEPIKDGARVLIKEAFEENENVRIVLGEVDKEGKSYPGSEGVTKSREWWLAKLESMGGSLDSYGREGGVFVGINPMKINGCKDEHVTDLRYVLCEFDSISSLEEQWNLVNEADIPCTAVMYSGNKSLHCWVRVDAENLAEWGQRRKMLFDHLADHVDKKNSNTGRLSRLPNNRRFDSRQELLALNVGASSWAAWENEIAAEANGERHSLFELATFDHKNDPDTLVGARWLCRGGSCLFVAQSGIGKSTLSMQLAISWAQGLPTFGIRPVKPLKVMLVQAENDRGDLSEMVQGALAGLNIKADSEAFTALSERLVVITDNVSTGEKFTDSLRVLTGRHSPDIVIVDPLLSFLGGDVSSQENCTYFLRNLLNPIAKESGCCWFMVHHTPKPSSDAKSKQGWGAAEYAYFGMGSSELVNWSRSVAVLRTTKDEGFFKLMLTKRGRRAEATHLEGDHTTVIHLKHSSDSILWEQIPTPVVVKEEPKAKKEPKPKAAPKPKLSKKELSKLRKEAGTKQIKDLDRLIERITEPMAKCEIYRIGEANGHGSEYLLRKNWSQIEARLTKTKNKYQQTPTK